MTQMGLVRHRARKTIKKRMQATPKAIKMELRESMHDPIERTGVWVRQLLQGYLT
jgi:hypothetical protein